MSPKKTEKKPFDKRKRTVRPTFSENYATKKILWCFDKIDRDGKFSFDVTRKDFDAEQIFKKLIDLNGMTWQNVLQATHDKKGKSKNHNISADSFCAEAKQRIKKLSLEEYSDAFLSIAITNKIRIFGIKDDAKFHVIWYDPNHEICPTK